jgi:hypothetical protein
VAVFFHLFHIHEGFSAIVYRRTRHSRRQHAWGKSRTFRRLNVAPDRGYRVARPRTAGPRRGRARDEALVGDLVLLLPWTFAYLDPITVSILWVLSGVVLLGLAGAGGARSYLSGPSWRCSGRRTFSFNGSGDRPKIYPAPGTLQPPVPVWMEQMHWHPLPRGWHTHLRSDGDGQIAGGPAGPIPVHPA